MVKRILFDNGDSEYSNELLEKERAKAIAGISKANSFIVLYTSGSKCGCVSAVQEDDMLGMKVNIATIIKEITALEEHYRKEDNDT